MVQDNRKKMVKKQIARMTDYRNVFGSQQGERVLLNMMDRHYVRGPTVNKNYNPHETFYKEGQRNVVLEILAKLKLDPEEFRRRMEQEDKIDE